MKFVKQASPALATAAIAAMSPKVTPFMAAKYGVPSQPLLFPLPSMQRITQFGVCADERLNIAFV
jgi:hypothetical protein